jgi:hypothetical protein
MAEDGGAWWTALFEVSFGDPMTPPQFAIRVERNAQ